MRWIVLKSKYSFSRYSQNLIISNFRFIFFSSSLCMDHITKAIEHRALNPIDMSNDDNVSIIDRILEKTGNPKIAAVLALDLFFVGVDTVIYTKTNFFSTRN